MGLGERLGVQRQIAEGHEDGPTGDAEADLRVALLALWVGKIQAGPPASISAKARRIPVSPTCIAAQVLIFWLTHPILCPLLLYPAP